MFGPRLRFNEAKATEAATRLLAARGGTMHYLKLIKLLYFADREALLRWGRPITTDRYVSMDNGPVVSHIYNLIAEEQEPGSESCWRHYISEPKNYQVTLLRRKLSDELSKAEEDLLDEIFEKFGTKNRWELVRIAHSLPEWCNPQGSAIPIEYSDIFKAAAKTKAEIAALEDELTSLSYADDLATLSR
jgi:uncharacterized phage-associated protein